jgi:hypothetical protein
MENRLCAARDCEVLFEPIREIQLYHSKKCKNREALRRYRERQGHPPSLPPNKPPTRTIAARRSRGTPNPALRLRPAASRSAESSRKGLAA